MIYLVDDDMDDLELVQEALHRTGFQGQLACANNGEDFLVKLHLSKAPALIVLDLNMPLKDGFEVLKELKTTNFSVVPVVILTASHNKQDEKRCFELGCNLFLRKPSTLEEYDSIAIILMEFLRNYKGNESTIIETPEG
ncbi:MAG TPA: response regulator [Ohtaekwangia sp.]|nr:response regulator [Ohtaekwangia sp.]